jgi:glycerate 2-kinase
MSPHILAAPDSFKGTFTAAEVAGAIARGVMAGGGTADRCPVADGGEGTMSALLAALDGGRRVTARAQDPLGRGVDAEFAIWNNGLALVETAEASGLWRLHPNELDPWRASTAGTGELIRAALAVGAREVLVAVGGSATVDGGAGALEALTRGRPDVRLTVLCDVTTPWERCAAVYGPQKGADPPMVTRLERRLDALADKLPRDPRGIPMTGAAGGLSGALWAAHDARLTSGAVHVLDVVDFDARLKRADAVICGEGRIDAQSAEGKIVGEIARRAVHAGVPVHALVGSRELDDAGRRALGLASITEAPTIDALEAAGATLAASLRAAHP